MAIAALDLGRRRIGIAIADNEGLAVHPIGALERRSLIRDLESIRARLVEFDVSHVIIGLPLNMDGSAGPAAHAAETLAAQLREACGLPVDLFDERLTSFEAETRLRELSSGRARDKGKRDKGRRDKGRIDAVAASLILEGWLRWRQREGESG